MSRGHYAETPMGIPLAGWKEIGFRVKDQISKDRVGLIAAGVAFYGLLALFPAITAIVAVAGLVVSPSDIVDQMHRLTGLVPEEVVTIMTKQATAVAGSSDDGLGLAAIGGLLLAFYSSSKGMGSLVSGINAAYNQREQRGFFHRLGVVLALTLFLIFGLIIAISITLVMPAISSFLGLGPDLKLIATAVLWVILFGATIFGLSVLYRFGPSRSSAAWKWISPGAVLGCILWIIASAGFAFYVSNFGSYNESFGTLAGVIVLLMWFWISAYVILLGAELNSEMEAQTRMDTTVASENVSSKTAGVSTK